eukprot:137982_1
MTNKFVVKYCSMLSLFRMVVFSRIYTLDMNHTINSNTELICNSVVKGELTTNNSNDHLLNLTDRSFVHFDSSESSFCTVLHLYDSNFTQLSNCSACAAQTITSQLPAGQYILTIEGWNAFDYGSYQINVACDNDNFTIYGCGHTVLGQLGWDPSYYSFNLTTDSVVLFDLCQSSDDIWFNLYDSNSDTVSIDKITEFMDCNHTVQLQADQYTVEINGYWWGHYQISVTCNSSIYIPDNNTEMIYYVYNQFDSNPYYNSYSNIYEMEHFCEIKYKSSLATVQTVEDIKTALHVIHNGYIHLHSGYGPFRPNVHVCVGMYTDLYRQQWRWITNWSRLGLNVTVKESEHFNHTDEIPKSELSLHRFVATLDVNISAQHAAWSGFSETPAYFVDSFDSGALLCNGRDSTYQPPICLNGMKCWNFENQIHDDNIMSDIVDFEPPVVFWNQKLFVFGITKIHHTNFNLFQYDYNWTHSFYNHGNFTSEKLARRYTHHESYVYFYSAMKGLLGDYLHYLIQVDLNNLQLKYYLIPNQQTSGDGHDVIWHHDPEITCIVATNNKAYVFVFGSVMVLNLDYKTWNISVFAELAPVSCSITGDGKFIYIISWFQRLGLNQIESSYVQIVKYRTFSMTYEQLQSPNLCGMPMNFVSSLVGADGNLIIHGCDIEPWKSLIFDPITDQFTHSTIDISAGNITDFQPFQYRLSQLIPYDDNILLLFYKMKSYQIYVSVTHTVSINFTASISENCVWPTDGFIIKYNVNNFDKNRSDVYYINLDTTYPNINTVIILNISNDHCICNESTFRCHHCQQRFHLQNYLSPKDNYIDK